ncbi:MAG: hypothetical protein M3326_15580, partial [Actinomycetota bacterium]|nr:hypothetical protein [Actinomycetota bacterium]
QPLLLGETKSAQAALALVEGRLADADRLANEARSAGDGIEPASVEERFQAQLRRIDVERSRFEELAERCRALLESRGRRPPRHPGCLGADLGVSSLRLGRHDEARRALDGVLSSPGVLGPDGARRRLCCVAAAAELCWALDDAGHAAALYDVLRPYAELHVVETEGGCSLGACARYVAQVAAMLGRFDEADAWFERAHRTHERLGAPAWLARSRADHARMLVLRGGPGDLARARHLADAAADAFTALGMGPYAEWARSGVQARATGRRDEGPTALGRARLQQEDGYWAFEYGGAVVRLRDSKGVRYLVRLLRQPGRELHALDLVGGGSDDAESTLTPEVKAAYRARMRDLRDELDEATANNDLARAARAQDEIDGLVAELSAVVAGHGPGGTTSDAERARQSVTRAVKGTVERLADADAALGLHLRSTVRTGVYSSYAPDPRAPIVWEEE